MIFQYGNNKAEIDENRIVLTYNGDVVLSKPTASIIQYSVCRPFVIAPTDWQFQEKEQTEDELKLNYLNETILAEMIFRAKGYALELELTFTNAGKEEIVDFSGGIVIPIAEGSKNKITIPHVIYNDNPSAEPERIVPHIGNVVGQGIIVEEHRLPIPAANVEWKSNGAHSYFTLFMIPDVKTGDEREYWSMGAIKEVEGESIVALSGPLMFNGVKDVFYGGRNTPLSYMKGYRYIRSGECIQKKFAFAWGQIPEEGKGFRNLVDLGLEILKPNTVRQHTLQEMIDYKKQVVDSRYYKDDTCCGYLTFGDKNSFGDISGRPAFFLYGWTGQSIKLAWCECLLGLTTEEKFRFDRGYEIIDFFVRAAQSDIPGLFRGYYMIEARSWRGAWDNADAHLGSRIEGENISDLVDVCLLYKEHGKQVPEHWEQAIRAACDFFMDERYQTADGIYPAAWELDGKISEPMKTAAGMPCVLALAKASEYFGEQAYLDYAAKKYEIYSDIHMKTFDIPFARATLDARCEDKEAGLYFFMAAAEIYRLTREERFKEWAAIAGDWILTFVFFWETGFQKDTVCFKKNFKTTGWPGVSVQNHHMDVFFPSYEMYAFGKESGIKKFEEMGQHVSNALTYGVCTEEGEWGFTVIGEQGEHYYHTNYFQVRYPNVMKHMNNYRGGMQVWNPSWITAQVLSSSLRFYLSQK